MSEESKDPWWLNLPACHACGHLASEHRAGIAITGTVMTATFDKCQHLACNCDGYAFRVENPRTCFKIIGFDPNEKGKE